MRERPCPALDRFRLAAAFLVAAIHTSPLATYSPLADFWLTRVLARVAVPFFFMMTGWSLGEKGWREGRSRWRRIALLYAAAVLLYLPLNLYNGGFGPGEWARRLLVEGSFYHLWYFPALLLGIPVAWGLSRLGMRLALPGAAVLYLIGLGGDSYYGLICALPGLKEVYEGIFSLFSYTRNGLFFAPLFLLLGRADFRWSRKGSAVGLLLSLAGMSAEGLWLHGLGVQRHDSMYLLLPVCMVFLFSLLRGADTCRWRRGRDLSLLIYLLHPWCIVLVRGGAKLVGLESFLIQNSLGHFMAVCMSSTLLSAGVLALRPPRPGDKSRAWREVDLEALSHNARTIRDRLGGNCRLMAVVKADGYGHGAAAVARTLQREGIRHFAVACLTEGIGLRKAGIRGSILILGYTPPEEAAVLARWGLSQTLVDEAHALALAAQGKRVKAQVAVDTGMHRLGVPAEDIPALERIFRLPGLRIEGLFSHLCVSDSLEAADVAFTEKQKERFLKTAERLRQKGVRLGLTHLSASYGIMNGYEEGFDLARVGIALYGVHSDGGRVKCGLDLRPVLAVRARVALVRELKAGDQAGYGLAYQAPHPVRLAVVTMGYADGLPRDWARRGGQVLIQGRRAPAVGRLCMDQMLVDVTGIDGVKAGDRVTLIGRDGGQELSAEEAAESCGTITNELLTKLSDRLPILT